MREKGKKGQKEKMGKERNWKRKENRKIGKIS